MHFHRPILILVLSSLTAMLPTAAQQDFSAKQEPAVLSLPNQDLPWLGFQVERVTDAVRAHLPDLPKGTGFVITSLESQSPSHEAGLLRHDVVWKLNDQLLINEAQLEVLLSHKQPGDSVKIHFFRSGAKHEVTLVIGKLPPAKVAIMGPSSNQSENSNSGNQQKIQLPQIPQNIPLETQKTATLELPNTLIQIETREQALWLSIDHKGVNIFDDELNEENTKKIPAHWVEPVNELRRTLENRPGCKPR